MTRIIAGSLGGRRIAVPPKGTRPTSDRVREALFTRLDHFGLLAGARVLDLYAGSGALGLEAASRGAHAVDLVEADRRAAAICRQNVASLGLAEVRVHEAKVESFLTRPWSGAPVTLAFLDPPYDLDEPSLASAIAHTTALAAPEAVLVIERSARSPEPLLPAGWRQWETRRYGETALHFVEAVGQDA